MFQGYVELEGTMPVVSLSQSSNTPTQLDALPSYRVYGPTGLMQNGTGTASFKDTNSIQGASNASPISVTSAGHGLTTGAEVTIAGALGNTAANGTFVVTVVDQNTFTLDGSTGNGAWTSGGAWNVTGLYTLNVAATSANGYLAGQTYSVLLIGALSSVAWADLATFTVV